MSDNLLRWIPVDPSFVPSDDAAERALQWLRSRAPEAAKVSAEVSPKIQFVDCGANLKRIRCSVCMDDVPLAWWHDAMERAGATHFADRVVNLPCCAATAKLEDLEYEWPQGFARFVLEARNADIGKPSDADNEQVARLLGTPVRLILAHY
jgi:hypothetical protein